MNQRCTRPYDLFFNLDTKKASVAAEYTDHDIDDFQWVNEHYEDTLSDFIRNPRDIANLPIA